MTLAIITNETLTDIGDAIREVIGEEQTYLPSEMPDAIRGLTAGGSTFAPQPVTGISAKVGHEKVGLLFDDPEDLSYLGYDIYEWAGTRVVRKAGSAPSSQSDGTVIANSTVHDGHVSEYLVDTGLEDGTTYYYGLFPYTTAGAFNTDASQVIAVTPSALAVGACTNLVAKVGNGKVQVSWSDPVDVADTNSRYGTQWASTVLVRKAGAVPTGPEDGDVLVTSTTRNQYSSTGYLDQTPDNGTSYYYAVFPVSADGAVGNVVAAAATPSALGIGSVTNLKVNAGNATAAITYTDPSDVSDTSVRFGATWAKTVLVRKAGSAPTSPSDGTVVLTSTTRNQYSSTAYNDTGVTNGTEYYYAAFAVSSDGVASTAATASATPTAYTPPTWADGTDAEIAEAIQKHRDGDIDLRDYWHVGDVREVPFTLYKASVADAGGTSQYEPGNSSNAGKWYNGATSAWEDVGSGVSLTTHWVIVDVNTGSSSSTSMYGSNATFIIQQVEAIQGARVNFSNINTNGWDGSALRKYLNGSYLVSGIQGYYDGLPSYLRSKLLPVSVLTADAGNSTGTKTSTDKLFLPAETEVFGSTTYANATAEGALKQWEYYKTADNRKKYRMGKSGVTSSADYWWERSPRGSSTTSFCLVNTDGTANSSSASYYPGLAPSGCI